MIFLLVYSGDFDVFISADVPRGNLEDSVYIGSSGYDIGKAIDLDSCGRRISPDIQIRLSSRLLMFSKSGR